MYYRLYVCTNITIGDEILDFFSITTTMVGNMPFPWFFMPTPGEPSTPFKMWRQIFDNYLLVIGGILGQMHIVGAYCYTVYSLPDTGTSCNTAMMALINYFVPKTNVIAERHAFCNRAQMSNNDQGETATDQAKAFCELHVAPVQAVQPASWRSGKM